MLVPVGIAYAEASGVPGIYGLYVPWCSNGRRAHLSGHALCIGDLRNSKIVGGLQIKPGARIPTKVARKT